MSAQVGIPKYKDLVNSKELLKLKETIQLICLNFSKLGSSEAIENRENESYDVYTHQYNQDLMYLKLICKNAQDLVNTCNDTLLLISERAIEHHVFHFDEEE